MEEGRRGVGLVRDLVKRVVCFLLAFGTVALLYLPLSLALHRLGTPDEALDIIAFIVGSLFIWSLYEYYLGKIERG